MSRAGTTTRQRWSGYLFVLPYLLLFGGFLALPLVFGLGLSAMKYEMLSPTPPQFAGLTNYAEALRDPFFWKALGVTTTFVMLASPLTILLALLLASLLNNIPDGRQNLYRAMIFLPTIVSIAVAALMWRWFYATEFGLFNAMLPPSMALPWLSKYGWLSMLSIVLMTLWWTVGGPMVVLLAGLKQIPDQYYEAAAIDGATGLRSYFQITLPLLKPVLLFVVVMNILGAFQVFGQPFLITRGGPERATLPLMQYIYETSFLNYRLGYGAAMSWMLFLVIAVFSFVQFRVMRERD
jgi:multiple sugar transport system permease protein